MLVVHVENSCKTTSKYQKRSPPSCPHPKGQTFICSMQMNSKLVVLTKNVHKQLFLHQNQLYTKNTSIPDVLTSFCIISTVLLKETITNIMLGLPHQLHAGTEHITVDTRSVYFHSFKAQGSFEEASSPSDLNSSSSLLPPSSLLEGYLPRRGSGSSPRH